MLLAGLASGSAGVSDESFRQRMRMRAIFYQEIDGDVVVLRVLHQGRDVMSLIGGDG